MDKTTPSNHDLNTEFSLTLTIGEAGGIIAMLMVLTATTGGRLPSSVANLHGKICETIKALDLSDISEWPDEIAR